LQEALLFIICLSYYHHRHARAAWLDAEGVCSVWVVVRAIDWQGKHLLSHFHCPLAGPRDVIIVIIVIISKLI
jgi:hypothetical protein